MAATTSAVAAPAPLHYRIDARIDAAQGVVSSHATISWSNLAADPRQFAICVAPQHRLAGGAPPLTRLVASGQRVAVDLQWTTTLSSAGGAAVIAEHWYPRAAVAADAGAAICLPLAQGRTSLDDPADFDVTLTAPQGWLVAATASQQPAGNDGATARRRFQQTGVREFVWVAGPGFIERTRRVDVSPRAIDLHLLLQAEHVGQADRLLDAAAESLAQHGRWLTPYPDDHLTIVDTGWRGPRIERAYPRLITVATHWLVPPTDLAPEAAIARGVSAQWWGGEIALDPSTDPGLADGLRDYFTGLNVEHLFDVRHQRLAFSAFTRPYLGGFIPWAVRDALIPRTIAYRTHAGAGWGTLERYLGAPTLQHALATAVGRYQNQRVSGREFVAAVGEGAGQDLRWFDAAVFAQDQTFDYAVAAVVSIPNQQCGVTPCFRTTVRVERRGAGQFTGSSAPPIGPYESGRALDIAVSFADGSRAAETWDGRQPAKTFVFRSAGPAASAVVDPDRVLLLDSKTTNNSWSRTTRAGLAATRWTAIWLTWLQDCLLSYVALV